MKRGLEAKEKEREMMKKLGKTGNAAGREYMERAGLKASGSQSSIASAQANKSAAYDAGAIATKTDALDLLLVGKDRAVHLSPIKRKRPESSLASSIAGSTKSASSTAGAAFGWGSNLSNKLSKMKEGEKLHKSNPPVRKKTRFVTEKGIRVAGRESLGLDYAQRQLALEDDDDDELVIVQ